MFEIGWTEMLVIAIVMIVVVGPKDLPGMLRQFGRTTTKLRAMAGDFRKQFDEALKEAELDDVKKSVDGLRRLNPTAEIRKQLNPFEKAAADVRAGVDSAMKPKPSTASEPAAPATHLAEPLKNGAVASSTLADTPSRETAAANGSPEALAPPDATPAAEAQVAAEPANAHPAPRSLQ
jgi:sec-independent protein translocase protein TatB